MNLPPRGDDCGRQEPIGAFIVALPLGLVGVAIALSISSPFVRPAILNYVAERSGPVNITDLWIVFLRNRPLWVVMFVATWLARTLVVNLGPLAQLLICAPVGIIVGAAFIYSFSRSDRQRFILLRLCEN